MFLNIYLFLIFHIYPIQMLLCQLQNNQNFDVLNNLILGVATINIVPVFSYALTCENIPNFFNSYAYC